MSRGERAGSEAPAAPTAREADRRPPGVDPIAQASLDRVDVEIRPVDVGDVGAAHVVAEDPEDGWPWLFPFELPNWKFEKGATSKSAVEVAITVPCPFFAS